MAVEFDGSEQDRMITTNEPRIAFEKLYDSTFETPGTLVSIPSFQHVDKGKAGPHLPPDLYNIGPLKAYRIACMMTVDDLYSPAIRRMRAEITRARS